MNFYKGTGKNTFSFIYLFISQNMMVGCYVDANILRKQRSVKINENQQILVFIIIIFDKLCLVMHLQWVNLRIHLMLFQMW